MQAEEEEEMKSKKYYLWIIMVLTLTMSQSVYATQKIPKFSVGYIFTTHHTPLIAAMAMGEQFKNQGVYLNPIIPKEKYELISGSKTIAILDIIVSKSGAETSTLFAQGRMDIGLASAPAIMTGVDQGTLLKILCPIHVDGMSLVFSKDSKLNGWDDFLTYIKGLKRPVKIGYHSPTSAPKIVLEGALQKAGVKVTQDANDFSANVVLVDLRTTSNLIPALTSKQVDGWVGPSPYPELAVTEGVGKIVLDLRNLPPEGHWHNFPCCVVATREPMITEHSDVLKKLLGLMTISATWCNRHKAEVSKIMSNWIGISSEAMGKSNVIFTTDTSPNWIRGLDIYLDLLNRMNMLSGRLKDKKLEQVKSQLLDLSITEKR